MRVGSASQTADAVSLPRTCAADSLSDELLFRSALSATTRLDLPLPYGPVQVNAPWSLSATCRAIVLSISADDCGQMKPSKAPGSPRSRSMRTARWNRRATCTR